MSLVSKYKAGHYNHVVEELKKLSNNFLANSPLVQQIVEKGGKQWSEVHQSNKDNLRGFPLKENVLSGGNLPFDAKRKFSSVREYLATIWLGAKIAQEIEEKDQESAFTAHLHIVGLEDGKLMCFFDIPHEIKKEMIKNPKARLEEGDHMVAWFQHDKTKRDSTVSYDLRIIEPLAFSKSGSLTAAMARRLRTSVVEETKLPDPPVTSLESLSDMSKMEKMKHIMAGPAAEVEIRTVWRHTEFVYVFKAALMLETGSRSDLYDIGQILLNPPARQHPIRRLDIYHTLLDKDLAAPDRLDLNESQKNALRMGRHAVGGFLVAHGGPGTGKTHFVAQILKPFFLDQSHHRILLTAAGNRGADNMARILHGVLQVLGPAAHDGVNVVRLHSVKTEIKIFLSDAKAERRRRFAGKKGCKINPTGNVKDAIATHFQAHAMGKYEATDDDRLQDIELSVGTHMRKNLSRAPEKLQGLYAKYANGDALGSEQHARLWEMAIEFLRSTIRDSTAVCSTVAGAFDHDVHESFAGAEMIVVDEAAKVMEYQLWPLFAFYKHARGKILVGDPDQLDPSGPMCRGFRNPFERQMALSLQARLQLQSFPSAFFDIQYRVVPEIAAIFSNTCYKSRLQSDVSTEVDNRPLAQAIREHNKLHYDVNHSVVFFDVSDSEEASEDGKSKHCDAYITTVSEIVEDLLMAGFGQRKHPCTIAILTTYKSEQRRLKYTWTKMLDSGLFDAEATVVVETVDKAQGMEYDIAIIDPVVVKSAGFLTSNRLNVLFSRARNGLYIVGDRFQWCKMFEKEVGCVELERFAAELWRGNRYVIKWPQKKWLEDRASYYDPQDFQ